MSLAKREQVTVLKPQKEEGAIIRRVLHLQEILYLNFKSLEVI